MIKFKFRPFQYFVDAYIIPKTVARAQDSLVTYIDISKTTIEARVRGTKLYNVQITFNAWEVLKSSCTCPYEPHGYCKHIVNTLIHADRILSNRQAVLQYQQASIFDQVREDEQQDMFLVENLPHQETHVHTPHRLPLLFEYDHATKRTRYELPNQQILELSEDNIYAVASPKLAKSVVEKSFKIQDLAILPNHISVFITGIATYNIGNGTTQGEVELMQTDTSIVAHCSCGNIKNPAICQHVFYALMAVIRQHNYFHLAFDHTKRHQYLREHAQKLGIPHLEHPDEIYTLVVPKSKLAVKEKTSLFYTGTHYFETILQNLEQQSVFIPVEKKVSKAIVGQDILLFHTKALYDDSIEMKPLLAEVLLDKDGCMTDELRKIYIPQRLKNATNQKEFSFISSYLILTDTTSSIEQRLDAYRTLLKNPLELPTYWYHDSYQWGNTSVVQLSEAKSVEIITNNYQIVIHVKKHMHDGTHEFYAVGLNIVVKDKPYSLDNVLLVESFIFVDQQIIFVDNPTVLDTLRFFKEKKDELLVHKDLFPDFERRFLRSVEQYIPIVYDFASTLPPTVATQNTFDQEIKRVIYLSESDDYVLLTPTVRYGETEISVLSPKKLYVQDRDENWYIKERNKAFEQEFIELLQTQHLAFSELPTTPFFYIHYNQFLENMWFQEAFEAWKNWNVEVLGYKNLKNNYNPNKMSARMNIASGIDWFDIETDISFGEQHVSLQDIQRSIINKEHFVVLDDGTKGLLPEKWVEKFERYFRNGELKKGSGLRIHKSNFQLIDELYEKEALPETIQIELAHYLQKLSEFQSIQHVRPPQKLQATLREYQKEGLNWLNFLYEFNFGGCLADDMGLGKTIQIIAYFLSRQEKGSALPHLVVMPTSLLFNWQHEVEKFAPHLRYVILHGQNRDTQALDFSAYDLILTSYGTMLSDIDILRQQHFDVIVLDESQAIKNPSSKRYKAVQLLHARQRIVATGTPIENNTFDLYAQLSFAMPGLLGSQKHFASNYSTPIDKFADSKRATELHQKIHPFVLRRTKQQVATELPPKTEITLYCPMEKHQQKVYDAYRTEFQRYLSGLSDDEMHKSAINVLQGLTKLRQICNSPALLSDEGFYGEESAKINELIEQIKQLKDEHKILVFSQFVSMLNLIQKRLNVEKIPHAYLTGQTKKRQQQVELFQNDPSVRVFLISLKAGGTGLNLTQAEYVFIVDPWWNPAVENQAIDRAYRIGQKNKVMSMRMITPNTIEEKIMELQQRKQKLAQDLIQTDENIFKNLSKDELISIL